jgi:hypothetical protein
MQTPKIPRFLVFLGAIGLLILIYEGMKKVL